MRSFAVSVAVLVLSLVACGGGGGLSRAEYAQKADAVCADYNKKLNALPRPTSQKELDAFVGKAVPLVDEARGKLADLKPPKDEEGTAKAWNQANSDVLHALEKLRDAAKAKDRPKMQAALREGNTANQHANDLARTLGMKACAK